MSSSNRIANLRLGTRGSLLARAQSQRVADELMALHAGLRVELIVFKTTGDQIADRPLHEFGGKGLFTKELEVALLDRAVDFVVHSFKDVPVTMPLVDASELAIGAVPRREDPRDALIAVGHAETARRVADLPPGARVATGSLRRRCQLLWRRPDLRVAPIRGNIDTRLRKLRAGEHDAIVLAAAGLKRAGLFDPASMGLLDELLSAPGQGALALQCRRDDPATRELLAAMHHGPSADCVEAERAIVRGLEGDCHSPIAALAVGDARRMTLRASVGARDGVPPVIEAAAEGETDAAVKAVLGQLRDAGAGALLAGR